MESPKIDANVPDDRESRARAAAEKLLALADAGPWSTADPGSIRRDELYDRCIPAPFRPTRP